MDTEQIERFKQFASGSTYPMPFVFTEREVDAARGEPDPAMALCFSFTCKEALLKATRTPFDFSRCEVLPSLSSETLVYNGALALKNELKAELGIDGAEYHCVINRDSNEIIASVICFGWARS